MDDMMMVIKVGSGRRSPTDTEFGHGLANIRRWGLVVMIAGLVLAGVAAAGFAGVVALPPFVRITALGGGLALASLEVDFREV